MIDNAHGLEMIRVPDNTSFEVEGTVFEFGQSHVGKVSINRTGVIELAAFELVLDIKVVRVEFHGDEGVGHDHFLKNGCISLGGQGLVRIGKVASVVVVPHGNTCRHLGTQITRLLVPLLNRVGMKDEFVETFAHTAHGHLLTVGGTVGILFLLLVKPCIHFLGILDVGIEESIDRINVDGYRNMLAVNESHDLVFVGSPFGELLDVFPNSFVVGMEEMGTVFGNKNTGFFVNVVVAITTNVVTTFDDEGGLVALRCVSFGNDRTTQSSPNDANIVIIVQRTRLVACIGRNLTCSTGGGETRKGTIQIPCGCVRDVEDNGHDEDGTTNHSPTLLGIGVLTLLVC
mmetsp:Transcript_5730/g.9992  ORF Transcript_5730/g.9992 Transcript_5730/m.9992 type:complete len:344 (-) Transcript_5730:19-1050(-)